MPRSRRLSAPPAKSTAPQLLSVITPSSAAPLVRSSGAWRLHRHADYQRVYKGSRKQFATLMTYFAAPRSDAQELDVQACGAACPSVCARVGLTAGKVLGKAVERNRIKRRMREAVRQHLAVLPGDVDVVLHPKRTVLEVEFSALSAEVGRIFRKLRAAQNAANAPQDREPTL